ncbi:glycosyltransferase family 2 protein [Candidatus Roizmanbacteria bacterium]|nr:glycosyltransferase family 2 protein [Candidatus Roizmanbacteria bacterium]
MMKYSLILPVLNEQETIGDLYDRVKKTLNGLTGQHEIIFINDGSTDSTSLLLRKLHDKDKTVKVINFSRNFGHQVAVTAGLHYCSGEYVAILDADLQDPPEILPKFFAKLDEGYDTAYAIRKKRKESIVKKIAYNSFYRILRSISNTGIPLDSGDFCVMNRKVVDAINSLPERNRFIRGIRSWVGFKQIGIEYERASRKAGESKYTLRKLFKLAFDGIFSFSYVPLQFMFLLGSIAIALSIIGSLAAIYLRYFTTAYNQVPGFATTIILVMFIGGLQLFSIGIMGEYLRRVYDEIKRRPPYIVHSLLGFTGADRAQDNQSS